MLIVLGTFLIGLTLLDALWTTVAPRGGGPVTKRLARGMWSAGLAIHRRSGGGAHGLLAVLGPLLLATALLGWVVGLWFGWAVIFSSDGASVVTSITREPASFVERIYFTGFVLFTLGTGDYVPVGGGWQVLSNVASLSGLVVVTLSVTYVLSVVTAVVAKRRLAGSIHSLGRSPEELVTRMWDGSGLSGLEQYLPALSSAIELHTQRHLAYPVLHYFHSADQRIALEPALAVLDDALLLLMEGLAPDVRPAPAIVLPARNTIESFLGTLRESFIREAPRAAPPPDLTALENAGIPTVSSESFVAAAAGASQRRKLLLGLVQDSGWGRHTWSG
ncbi:MAG: ion channel [Bacteroidota bacterium]